MIALLLSALAAAGFGISDFVGGLASRRVHVLRVVVVSYPLSLVMMVPLALAVGGSADQAALLIGALAGVCWSEWQSCGSTSLWLRAR